MAGEIESLDGDEPLERHLERHAYDRLIMLSDGIFAIAATLLALELRPPAQWDGTLTDFFAQSARPLFGYLFGFFVVAAFWFSHRNIFARLARVDTIATALTLVFLALVAIVPAAAALLAEHGPTRAIKVYFLLAIALGVAQLLLWAYVAYLRTLTHPDLSSAQRTGVAVQLSMQIIVGAIAFVAMQTGLENYAFVPILVIALTVRRWRTRHMQS